MAASRVLRAVGHAFGRRPLEPYLRRLVRQARAMVNLATIDRFSWVHTFQPVPMSAYQRLISSVARALGLTLSTAPLWLNATISWLESICVVVLCLNTIGFTSLFHKILSALSPAAPGLAPSTWSCSPVAL